MKSLGPFLNRDMGSFDRPRSLMSSLPVGLDVMDYYVEMDDFGDQAIDATNKWTVVKDAGASTGVSADADSGVAVLTSAATTDNDGASIQRAETHFLIKSGRKLWFEARVKVSSAADCDMFVGLADNFATNPEAVIASGLGRVGFELVDGSAVVQLSVDNATSTTRTSSGISMVDDTWIRLGFRTDGASIRFYINRALVGTVSLPTAIAAITMGPAFFGLSGSASGTHTRSIDYIMAAQERLT